MKVNAGHKVSGALLLLLLLVSVIPCRAAFAAQDVQPSGSSKQPHKRQIYREQVLPHAGGKIPDSAFETDRLALNRLQKEGIAVPDGVLLEQRSPQVFQYAQRSSRPVYRAKQTSDQRYTPSVGQDGPNSAQRIVDTTYALPQIGDHHQITVPNDPVEPRLRPMLLPNPRLLGGPAKKYAAMPILPVPVHYPKKYLHHAAHFPLPAMPMQSSVYPVYAHSAPLKLWTPYARHLPPTVQQPQMVYVGHPYWNYALPPEHHSNLIFNDFQSFFNNLYNPGHLEAAYYKHHSF